MGHQQEGDADFALDGAQFYLHGLAQSFVQRAQRFIQQQQLGLAHQGARQRHALALAAGELIGGAALQPFEPHRGQHGLDRAAQRRLRQLQLAQAIGDIVEDIEMRKDRVGLEHHVGGPQMRRHAVHGLAIDDDGAAVRRLEAGDHPQQGGLAAAGWAEQREEFAARHLQADVIHHRRAAEAFAHGANATESSCTHRRFCGAPRLRTFRQDHQGDEAVRISAPSASTMGRRSGKRSWPQI